MARQGGLWTCNIWMQLLTGRPTMSHPHSTKHPLYNLTRKRLCWMLGMATILSCWTLSLEMLPHSSQNGADTATFAPRRASMPQVTPIPAALMTSLLICLGNQRSMMTQSCGMTLWTMHSGTQWTTSHYVQRMESSLAPRNLNLPVTSLILADTPSPLVEYDHPTPLWTPSSTFLYQLTSLAFAPGSV